jgi:tRNA-dihydrouridine synthase B
MKLPFNNQFILAPMLEPNDIAFREICKKAGAGGIYSGMINPLSKKKLDLRDKPILQLFCNETKGIKEFIKKYDLKVSGWDFNLGCPSVVAKRIKVGSYMQEDLEMIEKILKEIRKNTKKFFSVKIRKSEYAFEILKLAEKYCDAIIIHSRTREQGYSGKADVDFALKIKKKSKIPVIYSGDVNEENAKDLIRKFDYLMIGRGVIGNPNIFARLAGLKKRFSFKDYLKLAEKYNISFKQIKFQAMNFTKGMEGATKLRAKLIRVKSVEEIGKVLM